MVNFKQAGCVALFPGRGAWGSVLEFGWVSRIVSREDLEFEMMIGLLNRPVLIFAIGH